MRARLATQISEPPPPAVQVTTTSSRRRSGGRLRLLIAMDLPDTVRLSVYAWGRQALADRALREVSEPNLHVPLLFIGQRPQQEVVRYLAAIRKACTGLTSPTVEFRDPEPRPTNGRPRSFALPAVSPGADVLHVLLCATLDAWSLRFHAPENRPFWPHLTIARVRNESESGRRPMRVGVAPRGPLPQALQEPFWGESVGLYKSEMMPEGVRHVLLGKVDLRSPF
jgi:2'-5' RNA ligase